MARDYQPGERVQVRDAFGNWHDTVARSGTFVNDSYAPHTVEPWAVVQVVHGGFTYPLNWPAADVRRPEREARDAEGGPMSDVSKRKEAR